MRRHAVWFTLACLFSVGVFAGDRPPADPGGKPVPPILVNARFLRDFAETRGFMLGRPTKAIPTPDGKFVLFLRAKARSPEQHLFEFNVETKETRELLTPEKLLQGGEEKLSPEEKARRERMRITAKGFADFHMTEDGNILLVSLSGRLFTIDRKGGDAKELPTGNGVLLDPKFSPDGKYVSYVLDHDVYVMDLANKKESRITRGGTAEVSHGLAEFVAQEEMDRHSGYWWSPDSKFIVYQETDAREVETWYVADPARPGEPPHAQRYPRPGKNNVKVRLGVVSVPDVGETTWIDWDTKRYEYLTTVRWDKGGPLTLCVQTRDQKEINVLKVDEKTGKTTSLLVAKDAAWLNIDPQMPQWLEDGSGFLWVDQHKDLLELRDAEGKHVRNLVDAGTGFDSLVHLDQKSRTVWFLGGADPTERLLGRTSLDGGKARFVAEAEGLAAATFAKQSAIFVKRTAGPKSMWKTTVHKDDGSLIAEIPSVAEEPPFVPRTEWIKLALDVSCENCGDGKPRLSNEDFYGTITRPREFEARRSYPVILEVYGGPLHQMVLQSMGHRLMAQWLADQGFIVVAIDNRGTPRRGRDWERSIKGSFARIPLDDQTAVLKELGRKYKELDLNRVGITGWSFGGYLAALGVLRKPDFFKAAVAGAPVVDWQDYDTHYTERYLGLPAENPQGYKESSLLTYAGNLKRPLLLIHGTSDDNVFFLHSLKLADALFREGKEFELLPLSGFTHMVPDPAVRERLQERIVQFFKRHL